jgi:hypothetical protein
LLKPDHECELLSMPFGIKRENCAAAIHPFVGPMNALIAQSAGDCDVSLDRRVVRADGMSESKHCSSAVFTSLTFIACARKGEAQTARRPYEPTREAAMAALAKSCRSMSVSHGFSV